MRKTSDRFFMPMCLYLGCYALLVVGTLAFGQGSSSAGMTGGATPPGIALEPTRPAVQRFEQNGLAVELAIRPLDSTLDKGDLRAGHSATVDVSVTDAKTGAPILGIRPRAWITGRPSEMIADETVCADKIRPLVSGRLGSRAEVDLNQYVVLTMNHDKTVTVINPQLDFSLTKLENLVTLPGVGADWVLSQDSSVLYVTMPDEAAVAVIDTYTRRLIHTVTTGAGSRPERILLQPDGRKVWVGLDGTAQVAAIDTATHRLTATVSVGKGLHALAATADSRFLYVANSKSNQVSAIDAQTHAVVAAIPVGETPVALTFSSVARRFYVGALNSNIITVINPSDHRAAGTISTKPGVVAIAAEPQGRFVLAVNQMESTVSVIDTATSTVTLMVPSVKDPDQIAFTTRYAYIRGIESEKVTLFDLQGVRQGKVTPLDIQVGRKAPSAAAEELGMASMIVPTPEGNAVMVANAPDQTLYFYQEGMMAPMGTFSNYKRMPRGILILDRSLREVAPGVYRAPVTFPKAGRYDVPLLIDKPRITHCFQTTVQESLSGAATVSGPRRPIVQTDFGSEPVAPKVPTKLAFTLKNAATQEPLTGLRDVQVLVFEPPGSWQQRHYAQEIEPGRYAVTQSFPHVGEYRVMVQALSQHLRYADGVPVVQQVMPATSRSDKPMQRADERQR